VLTRFIRIDLVRHPGRAALVVAAVAVSVAVVTGASSLMLGVYEGGIRPLVPSLPLGRFKVEGRRVDVGILSLGSLGQRLDDDGVQRLGGLPGVRQVIPIRSSAVPMRAAGGQSILGRSIRTDIFAQGAPRALVADALSDAETFDDVQGEPVPVVISSRLLDLYNGTVAPVLGQPKLSEQAVKGLQFELILGISATRGNVGRIEREVARVVGLSDQASLAGITVPAATVRRWDEAFQTSSPITQAWVEVDEPEAAGRVARAVEQAGFRVDETPKLIGWALILAGVMGGVLAAFLLLLGALVSGLAFSLMVSERRIEISVLRALGAERARILRWFLGQAVLLGLMGGALGCGLGWSLSHLGHRAMSLGLAGTSIQPDQWLRFPPWMWASGVLVGALAAGLGAFGPALRAARADPSEALRT
jgi:hypothetical protein